MMRSLVSTALLALLALLAAPAAAGGDAPEASGVSACVARAVEAVQARYESVRDMRARFEQTTRSVALGGPGAETTSRGSVAFAKPGKMRWSYSEPEESLVVSDGQWLWLYDPAHAEVQKLPVGDGYLSGAAIQFLLGEGRILEDFRVEALHCDDEGARLALWPRAPATYEKLGVVADARSGDVLETEIVDLLGNVTRVRFRELEVNPSLPDDFFRFRAPRGVRVIELEAPGGGP